MSGRILQIGRARLAWLDSLRDLDVVVRWSLADWERVIRLSRRLRLLGRIAEAVDGAGYLDRVPPQPRRHLIAEQRLSRWRTGALTWALERIGTVLHEVEYPLVLLKGAAYLGQDLPIAAGRLPSDVDILVPKVNLPDAVERLQQAGWKEADLDEHDRRYYYEWSHEVPPMTHPLHGLELDLHHNILPPIAATRVDADRLLERLRPSKWEAWQVFDPIDQVLHSAAHLFHDSEAKDRIRDLVDLDGLFRHFGESAGFWMSLPSRARELGLSEPLALAVHYTRSWLRSPIPDSALGEIENDGPGAARRAWLTVLWDSVLMPADVDSPPPTSQRLAATALLARYHWNRMPLRLLVPHLWHQVLSSNGETTAVAQEKL